MPILHLVLLTLQLTHKNSEPFFSGSRRGFFQVILVESPQVCTIGYII